MTSFNPDIDVVVRRHGDTLKVWSPYDPAMVARARGLGGTFAEGCWTLAARHEEPLRAMLREIDLRRRR